MPPGDGWTSRLVAGLAAHLHTAGAGVWRPTGTYQPNEVSITIRSIPQQPDRLITLAPYPVDDGSMPGLADHQVAVQIRVRGTTDPRVADDIADAVHDVLDGAHGLTWGGIAVVQCWRQSYTSLGADTNGRWEKSENYYLDTMRPTVWNTD